MNARAPLSAVVTTFDNAATLDRCLASLAFCDEVVVLDSGSSDATREIAQQHGARIDIEPFKGYGAQKQSAIDKAMHDWVLLLDADEYLTDAGREAITRELQSQGYEVGRNPYNYTIGWVHGVQITEDGLKGGADPGRDGVALGTTVA